MDPWLSLGASVGSTLLSSLGGKSAAEKQRQAAETAAALKSSMFEQGKALQTPFYDAGTNALDQLMQRLPDLTSGYDPSKLTTEPGYQFGLREGQAALERSLAARGRGVSGGALTKAAEYGTNYATTKLGDAFNRDRANRQDAISLLLGLTDRGQRAGENVSAAGNAYATGAGNDMTGAANAAGASDIAQGNLWGNLLNQGASLWNNRKVPGGVGTGGTGTTPAAGNPWDGYFAEGGEVPRVGTKAPPRRGGTGGGMSREQVLEALGPPLLVTGPDGVAALPADPVRNPRAIVDDRARKAGAYAEGGKVKCADGGQVKGGAVKGKGGGKADDVTAHLSGGEHVFDAEVVAMLGDGNTEAGHKLLEELKARVRAYKRQAPAGRPAPSLELEQGGPDRD